MWWLTILAAFADPISGCNVHGCWTNGGGCNVHGCWNSPAGSCNVHGCSDFGACNVHGCPQAPDAARSPRGRPLPATVVGERRCTLYGFPVPDVPASCNVHGCYAYGGGCNVHGCWKSGGGCNVHGCWNSPGGSCNVHGCTDLGECSVHGCPPAPAPASLVCFSP